MRISDQVALAAKNLSRRKGRTALTVIGVVVGTCAVIVMISLGIAQNKAYDEMLSTWGDLTQIQVYGGGVSVSVSVGSTMISSDSGSSSEPAKLNDEMVESFKKMDHVVAATPYMEGYSLNGYITSGLNDRYQMSGLYNLYGIDPAAMEPMGFSLTSGEWLSDTGNYGRDVLPILVGEATGYNFEDTRRSQNSAKRYRYQGQTDANGNLLEPFVNVNKDDLTLTLTNGDIDNPKTKTWKLKVVGTMAMDERNYWTQNGIVLRLKDMKMLAKESKSLSPNTFYGSTGENEYQNVYVKVDELDHVDEVSQAIKDLGFGTYSMSDTREAMQQQVARNQMMLGGLAAISLFVAALNIANTMTMAIYERTREIGVMKVLGCELRNIRRMFLIESGFIGFIGGVAGALLSCGVGLVLNNLITIAGGLMALLNMLGIQANIDVYTLLASTTGTGSTVISVIPPWLVAAALAFATVIGVLSGIAPANRAVKISALEAIRHE